MSYFGMIERKDNLLNPFYEAPKTNIEIKQNNSINKETNKMFNKNKEIEINVKYIIEKKPSINTVRKFMAEQINSIKSEECLLFEHEDK